MQRNEDEGILLIHPPAAKACEPPAGVARLAGALASQGIPCRIWDANLEGQLALLHLSAKLVTAADDRRGPPLPEGALAGQPGDQGRGTEAPGTGGRGEDPSCDRSAVRGNASPAVRTDAWTRRAGRGLESDLALVRSPGGYANPDRYRRAVLELNRLLAVAAEPSGGRLSLADYEDGRLSPLRSADLIAAAATPETNPFFPWLRERLPEILAERPFPIVGISLNFLSQALTAFALIGLLRRAFPGRRIVLGGGLATSWLRRPGWRNPFAGLIDQLVAGPGEAPLLALWGKQADRGGGAPDYAGLRLADYLAPGLILPYSASDGCWWRRCSFCPERAEGNPYRPISPRRAAEELRLLAARFRPALIHLLDNALSPAQLAALTADPPGAPWYGFSRIIPRLADRGFVRRLRDAGCVLLKLGLESGDQGVLDALHKGFDLSLAEAVLAALHEAGIAAYVYLLFGTPAETAEAAGRTLAFTAAQAGRIGFLNLAVFNLPRHGPEVADLDTGEFYAGDLSLYRPFVHPQGWGRSQVRRFLGREFKRAPAVREILRRDPPLFTSNHAPFIALAGRN